MVVAVAVAVAVVVVVVVVVVVAVVAAAVAVAVVLVVVVEEVIEDEVVVVLAGTSSTRSIKKTNCTRGRINTSASCSRRRNSSCRNSRQSNLLDMTL